MDKIAILSAMSFTNNNMNSYMQEFIFILLELLMQSHELQAYLVVHSHDPTWILQYACRPSKRARLHKPGQTSNVHLLSLLFSFESTTLDKCYKVALLMIHLFSIFYFMPHHLDEN